MKPVFASKEPDPDILTIIPKVEVDREGVINLSFVTTSGQKQVALMIYPNGNVLPVQMYHTIADAFKDGILKVLDA